MTQADRSFSFEVLVELMAAHDGQSPDGSPVSRVEARLSLSLDLARKAGLNGLNLHLDRQDMAWLCQARGIDRLSAQVRRLEVDGVPVHRATAQMESHIRGHALSSTPCFPVIRDPSLTPGFEQHVATIAEKLAMLAHLQRAGRIAVLEQFGEGATRQ